MKILFKALILSLVVGHLGYADDTKKTALPVPGKIRVAASGPRLEVWNKLSAEEKKFAFHLIEASRAGRAILFAQNHRHALSIKAMLETALSKANIDDTHALLGNVAFEEFLNYGAKFEDLAGPYEASNRKYILSLCGGSKACRRRHLQRFRRSTSCPQHNVRHVSGRFSSTHFERAFTDRSPSKRQLAVG